ncbi:MFS family permease [Sphingomonas vulcanisoli]|uniref:MFS family permease n=1 Tax=Sphingomonas vulcanisoli TaxID=1658060 RepID=A0ABX0TX14_9SPHN|nr:MFS transporter [Sphingomonas vulcanisoli]NIJ09254.1 MFS family permease [Sphingomonas vulcanisoli]
MLTRQFIFLCLAIFVTFANQAMLIPTIPLYINSLGGSASLAGLALFTFAVPSFLVRPLMGNACDKWGGAFVLIAGLGILAIGGLLYFIPYMAAVFAASILRGTAWGATSTGGLALLVTTSPQGRRGEASGYYNSAMTSASILFPAVALWMIHGHGGYRWVFLLSIVFGVLAIPMTLAIRAPREPTAAMRSEDGGPPQPAINRGIILAMLLNLGASIPQPAIVSFLPLYAKHLQIGDVGLFYVISGILTVVLRPLLGKRSDSLGRGPYIALGFVIQAIGFTVVFFGTTKIMVLTGAVIASFGPALVGAASMALAMDFAPVHGQGRSMATYSMTYQLGGGLGSMLAGGLADMFGLPSMYIGALVVTLFGAALLAATWREIARPQLDFRRSLPSSA